MVSRKCLKKVDLENFRSESFSIRTSEGRAPASELVLQRGSLPSEIALQGGNIESKMVYRGVSADLEKPKIFSANNEQGTRIFTLGLHYSCIPSYNNIVKIFSNRPAVAGLIKKSSLAGLIKKVQLSWTNQKVQL